MHTSGPIDTPTAEFVTVSDWHEETGRVEVYACTVCGAVFGLDRSGMFVAVPDECVT
jgi:peroxiredoxin family protein